MSDVRNYSKDFLTEFIQLYKSLPALWHIKGKDYSNRNKKNEAYRVLVKKFKEVCNYYNIILNYLVPSL